MTHRQKLSIIIPAFNEEATIEELIRQVLAVPIDFDKELIVVDDSSQDGTRGLLLQIEQANRSRADGVQVKVLFHNRNRGKGAAIRTAVPHATGDIIIIQDADLELDPRDYTKLLTPLSNGEAEVVYGNRFHQGRQQVRYRIHYWGNCFLTALSNFLTRMDLGDMGVGYKVFRREVLQGMTLRSNRFGFDPEVTMKVARLGLRIKQVPISYNGRTYGEGKKIKWKDGLLHIYYLLRFRFFD